MPPKRIACPNCANKFYSDWFPKFGRPDAKCFMCLTNENIQYLESIIKSHNHAIDELRQENADLKAELKKVKASPSNIPLVDQTFQVVHNKRKLKPTPKKTPGIPTANRFSALDDENDLNSGKGTKQEITEKKKSGNHDHVVKYSKKESSTLVVGDSILRGQGAAFATNNKSKKRSVKVVPGSKIDFINKDIEKTTVNRDACLVVNVGTNDAYDGGIVSSTEIMNKYASLIKTMKEKSDKCVINGILPRLRANPYCRNRVREINKSLNDMCNKEGVYFNDTWDKFACNKDFFKKDGVHLSMKGVDQLSMSINMAVFKVCEVHTPPSGIPSTSPAGADPSTPTPCPNPNPINSMGQPVPLPLAPQGN